LRVGSRIALLPALVAAVLAALLVAATMRLWPRADPAAPAVAPGAARRGLSAFVHRQAEARSVTALGMAAASVAVVAGASVAGIVFAMVRTSSGLARFDLGAAEWAGAHASDTTATVLRLLTDLGSTVGVLLIAVVVAVTEARRGRARVGIVFLVVVLAGEELIVNGVKALVDRSRPDVAQLVGFASASFPSGHSATAAAMWAAFALLLGRGRSRGVQTTLAALAAAVAAAVASSRVLLGVHWLTDVVAGLAVGWAWFAACSIAFGGRLVRFAAPAEPAERRSARPPRR
jgi:undecaprenyl-diphosphatase